MEELRSYEWPGNVRELRNVIERAMIIAKERFIRPEDLPERIRRLDMREDTVSALQAAPRAGNLRRILAETERQVLQEALRAADGNKVKAARILGIHRTSLYEKMKTHGLAPDQKVDFSL
jgi:DNA-binding NtrC family response regulator